MSIRAVATTAIAVLLGAPLAAAPAQAQAQSRTLTLDPQQTKITFFLGATGHDVEGLFSLRSGAVRFDAAGGAAAGEIVVDLTGAKTGSEGRDRDMHEEVLETGKFPLAVFRPSRLSGTLAPAGSSQVTLEGTLTFHGADHPVAIPARVTVDGSRLTGTAELAIPFVAWGLHDPSVFILRVDKQVAVKIELAGELAAAP